MAETTTDSGITVVTHEKRASKTSASGEGAEARTPLAERAGKTAQGLIDKKTGAARRKFERSGASSLKGGEGALLLADNLKTSGWSLGEYQQERITEVRGLTKKVKGVELKGGLEVTTKEGKTTTVTFLTGDNKPLDGKPLEAGEVLTYTFRDPDDPDIILHVTGEELYNAQLKSEAKPISELFTDSARRDTVFWHANGGNKDSLPSGEIVDQAEAKLNADPIETANEAIASMITPLQESLKDENLSPEQRKANEASLNALLLAQRLDGDVGRLMKLDILNRLADTAGPNLKQNLEDIIDELEPARDKAQKDLLKLIRNSGRPDKIIKAWEKIATKADGLYALIADDEFTSLPDMNQAMYGKTLSTEEAAQADKLIEDFASTHPLSKEQKDLIEYGKKAGKSMLWILAAILGAGAMSVAVIGAGAKMTGSRAA